MDLVRIGVAAKALNLHENTLRTFADGGVIPSHRTPGGQRLFDLQEVRKALTTRDLKRHRGRSLQKSTRSGEKLWRSSIQLKGLEEDQVWREIALALEIDKSAKANGIIPMAFMEMLNNAIDHSEGTVVKISFQVTDEKWSFRIEDNGVGVFGKVQKGFHLATPFESIAELSKGKRTTAPARHSGEGIFFTSKSVDHFQLESNGISWEVDNLRNDFSLGQSKVTIGTQVSIDLEANTTRTYIQVFEEFTVNHEWVRTRPVIKLFEQGMTFASRSEARRLLKGLEKFPEVELDFSQVDSIGQAFVDEVFRVWAIDHPDQKFFPINMNPVVEFMVNRGSNPILG